jgi:hypothetical protein
MIQSEASSYIANGKRQQLDTYESNSSPTASGAAVKFIYAKVAAQGRIICTFDVKGAYLKSDIDQEIYMLLPKRSNTDDSV